MSSDTFFDDNIVGLRADSNKHVEFVTKSGICSGRFAHELAIRGIDFSVAVTPMATHTEWAFSTSHVGLSVLRAIN